jgi:hypothetical protein
MRIIVEQNMTKHDSTVQHRNSVRDVVSSQRTDILTSLPIFSTYEKRRRVRIV